MINLPALLHDRHYHRRWRILLLLLMAVVSWFAFMPDPGRGGMPHGDKINHILAFAALGCVAALAGPDTRSWQLRVVLGLLGYGVFIEMVQSYLPTHQADVLDLLADAVGVTLGLTLTLILRRHHKAQGRQI